MSVGRLGRGALPAIACALGILVPAVPAHGQAAVDQYIPSPNPADTGSQGADPSGAAGQSPALPSSHHGNASAQTNSGSTTGGGGIGGSTADVDLPETGYPLSPFAAVVGGALILGLIALLVFTFVQRRDTADGR